MATSRPLCDLFAELPSVTQKARAFDLNLRLQGDNRPKNLDYSIEAGSRKLYFLSVGFLQEAGPRFLPASWRIAARSGTRVRLRSSLSQYRSRWSGLLPAGPTTRTRSSYADARFVNRIRLLVMGDGASRRTTSITTGSVFGVAAARTVGGRSRFFHCFLFRTPTSACLRAARRCGGASRNTAHGRRQCRS